MALRLRRGTEAERSLITPASGELIYTTDTKRLYVGDGTTPGGNVVSGKTNLSELDDVGTALVPPTDGQVLTWDAVAEQWLPTTITVSGGTGDGVVEGSNYRINIVGDDSSLIVDSSTGTIAGNFFGNINATGTLDGDLTGSVFGDDSTVLVDAVNNLITGDISTQNITTPLGGDLDINNVNAVTINKAGFPIVFLNNNQPTVDLHAGADLHGLLIFRTTDLNGVKNSSLIGSSATGLTIAKSDAALNLPDSHKIHIGTDGNFGFGTLTPTEKFEFIGSGKFSGSVEAASFKGSIVADDSAILVDAVSGTIPGYMSIAELQSIVAASIDFSDFQNRIAAL